MITKTSKVKRVENKKKNALEPMLFNMHKRNQKYLKRDKKFDYPVSNINEI